MADTTPTPPKDRSVNDFHSAAEVARGLLESLQVSDSPADWVLQNYDAKTTVNDPNDPNMEFQRLMTLKSYNILDTENEVEFDELTREAKEFFGCPIAVVSLIDMGRQWFKSIQGLDAKETPRCLAFCAHVVKRKEKDGVMVVTDAAKDPRFAEHPLVTDGPKIRFYAGAPLVSPEGDRLGSFCVIDFEPHPEGLSEGEKERLECYAKEAVLNMIVRA
jgi:GAF domain-containing protein